MLAATIATIIAILVVIVAASVGYVMYTRSHSPKAQPNERRMHSIDSVGINSSSTQVEDSLQNVATPVGKPADLLKSRLTFMEGLAAVIFGALAIKTFTMQVIDTSQYAAQSDRNRFSTVSTPAPRGYIYDADGVALVQNRSSLTVLADADVADNRDTVNRLSAILGIPHNIVRKRIQDATSGAQAQRVVASDVRMRDIAFISEHADAFSGVTTQTRTVRQYPYGALAAHILGYVGVADESDLAVATTGRTIEMGDNVGKSGVEASYDRLLAGDHGQRKVTTDANGNVVSIESETQPTKGSDVRLTIKAGVQYIADTLLADKIAPGGTIGKGTGSGGAIVCMDVRDGGIIAMASYPNFLPEEFIGGISEETWAIYSSSETYYPLMNRAIAGTYPAASTFKAFSGLAGMKYGFVEDDTTWECEGYWDGFGSGDVQMCWEHAGHGELDFYGGIVNSCDVVFYEIAKSFYDHQATIGETAFQDEIMKFNFGQQTGIDLDGEAYGRVPTPAWKLEYFKNVPEEASWRGGDYTNMAIGQGYVLVTPMQLAVAYGAIATGNLIKPHLFKDALNENGEVVVSHKPEIVGQPDIEPKHLVKLREALHGVRTTGGTLCDAFDEFDVDAAAKTGTAEVAGKNDFAWTLCYGPFEDPHYVVACLVEEGEGGAATASPMCAEVLAAALGAESYPEDYTAGYIAGFTGKTVEIDRSGGYSRTD